MTSTARPARRLLVLLLRRLGADPIAYIPDRLMEGYGPSGKALVELKDRGASLAVTRRLRRAGLRGAGGGQGGGPRRDRRRSSPMRDACCRSRIALINPNRLDESEDGRGARPSRRGRDGVPAWRGACSASFGSRGFFDGATEPKMIDLLDLVALGTVADVARLKTLNRAFVTQGLKVMAARQNIGLVALAEAARLVKAPTCRDLGFALGPRINAGGRVGKSDLGVRLLTSHRPRGSADASPPSSTASTRSAARSRCWCASRREEQAGQAQRRAGAHRHGRGLASRRDRHRRRPHEGTLRPPRDRHRRDRGRHRQGLGPLDQRRRPRRRGARRQGQRAAGRRRRPCHGGGADARRRAGSRRSATSSTSGSLPTSRQRVDGRALLLDALLAPGGVAGEPVRRARRGRALWRRLAGAARRRRPGAADQGRHRRRRPCPRHRLRRRRQELQVDRLPKRRDRAWARRCSPRPATSAGGSPARSSATNGTAATRPKCIWRTPRLLDPLREPLA